MADDFRVPVGFLGHPKTVKLKRRLGAEAVLCLQQLWEFCARTDGRHRGDLSGMDNEDVAIAANWPDESDKFVSTLLELRFLDGEPGALKLHDWDQHQPHVADQDDRKRAARRAARARWSKEPTPPPAGGPPSGGAAYHDGTIDPHPAEAGESQRVVSCGAHANRIAGRIEATHAEPAKGNAPSYHPTIHPSIRPRTMRRAHAAAYRAREQCASGTEGVEPHDSVPAWTPIGGHVKQLLLDLGF